jgi:hypothetical protein
MSPRHADCLQVVHSAGRAFKTPTSHQHLAHIHEKFEFVGSEQELWKARVEHSEKTGLRKVSGE